MGCLALRMFGENTPLKIIIFVQPHYKEMHYERTCVLQTQVLRSHFIMWNADKEIITSKLILLLPVTKYNITFSLGRR